MLKRQEFAQMQIRTNRHTRNIVILIMLKKVQLRTRLVGSCSIRNQTHLL